MNSSEVNFLNRFSVILVEPQDSLNIGSVVRAMANFGFKNLSLVAPRDYDPNRAMITACHGENLLEKIRIFSDLPTALLDVNITIGFSAKFGHNRDEPVAVDSWIKTLSFTDKSHIGLIFGCESSGLTSEHLSYCNNQVYIPCSSDCSSLNLAQAVIIPLYELFKLVWYLDPTLIFELQNRELKSDLLRTETANLELASGSDFLQLDRLITSALTKANFYKEGTPAPVPLLVRRMFRKLQPNKREMGILLGAFSRINNSINN
jgi:tRNA/rRNA methyltransferase